MKDYGQKHIHMLPIPDKTWRQQGTIKKILQKIIRSFLYPPFQKQQSHVEMTFSEVNWARTSEMCNLETFIPSSYSFRKLQATET